MRLSFLPFALEDFSKLCSVASDVMQEVELNQTEQMVAFPKVPDLCGRTEIDFLKCQGAEVLTGIKSKLYTSGL